MRTGSVSGLDIQTAGLILLIVGVLGLVLSLLMLSAWTDRRRRPAGDVVEERRYRDDV